MVWAVRTSVSLTKFPRAVRGLAGIIIVRHDRRETLGCIKHHRTGFRREEPVVRDFFSHQMAQYGVRCYLCQLQGVVDVAIRVRPKRLQLSILYTKDPTHSLAF